MVTRTSIYISFYDLLNGNIGSYNSSSQPTVTSSFIADGPNFPQIVISDADKSEENFAFKGGVSGNREAAITFSIYTNTSQQNSSAQKDKTVLADDVEKLIKDNIPDGLSIADFGESHDEMEVGGNKIKSKTLSFVFTTR